MRTAIRLAAQHLLANRVVRIEEMRIAERYRKPVIAVGHVQQTGLQARIGRAAEALVALIVDAVVEGVLLELIPIGGQLADAMQLVANALLQSYTNRDCDFLCNI